MKLSHLGKLNFVLIVDGDLERVISSVENVEVKEIDMKKSKKNSEIKYFKLLLSKS